MLAGIYVVGTRLNTALPREVVITCAPPPDHAGGTVSVEILAQNGDFVRGLKLALPDAAPLSHTVKLSPGRYTLRGSLGNVPAQRIAFSVPEDSAVRLQF